MNAVVDDKTLAEASRVPPSLDEQIKLEQLKKLRAEVRHLSGVSFDTLAKLAVAMLGICAAAWTFWTGVPQARWDAAKARQEAEAAKGDADAAKLNLDEAQTQSSRLANELVRKQEALIALNQQFTATTGATTAGTTAGRRPASAPTDGTAGATAALGQGIAAAARPTVFVQFAGDLNREKIIDPLRETLGTGGFSAPPAERINRGQSNEVRYFGPDDHDLDAARRAAEVTRAFFAAAGCPLPALAVRHAPLKDNRRSPIELWLMHACPTK